MARLKVYTVGNDGFVSPTVIAALGLPSHIRQADVYLIAHSKAEAVRVADASGFRVWPSSPDFRQNDGGGFAVSLLAHFDQPAVVVTAMVVTAMVGTHGNGAVLVLTGRDEYVRVGSVGRDDRSMPTFVPEEN